MHIEQGHQASVCDTATAGDLGTTDHLPQGSQKLSVLNQSVQELLRLGAIDPTPTVAYKYNAWRSDEQRGTLAKSPAL